MPPLPLLTRLDLLTGNTVLDVGTRDGAIATQFADRGFTVTAVDPHPTQKEVPNVTLRTESIEHFLDSTTERFDIIVARHVLPFTPDPLDLIQKLSARAHIFYFTCFGERDDWRDRADIVTVEKTVLHSLFDPATIRHYSETFEQSRTYRDNIKHWHIHTFVLDNRTG